MRTVVDSNFLNSPELELFLAKSGKNHVVLTDYAAMEAYKGDTLASIYHSMSILSRYPRQVVVLKSTGTVCGLSGRSAGLTRRMIDEGQTREFDKFCFQLLAAKRGNTSLQKQLLAHGQVASEHMDRMLQEAADLPRILDELAANYSNNELKVLRNGTAFTTDMIDKLIRLVLEIAASLFRGHPRATKIRKVSELPNTFIFRYALCAYVLAVRWIAVGGAKNVRPDRIRNDVVDVSFAAYATYFDGLLTADKKLSAIYEEANYLLHAIFVVQSK